MVPCAYVDFVSCSESVIRTKQPTARDERNHHSFSPIDRSYSSQPGSPKYVCTLKVSNAKSETRRDIVGPHETIIADVHVADCCPVGLDADLMRNLISSLG